MPGIYKQPNFPPNFCCSSQIGDGSLLPTIGREILLAWKWISHFHISSDSSFHSLLRGLYFLVRPPTMFPCSFPSFLSGILLHVPCPFPLMPFWFLFHCPCWFHYSLVEDLLPVPLPISIIPCWDSLPLFPCPFHYSLVVILFRCSLAIPIPLFVILFPCSLAHFHYFLGCDLFRCSLAWFPLFPC